MSYTDNFNADIYKSVVCYNFLKRLSSLWVVHLLKKFSLFLFFSFTLERCSRKAWLIKNELCSLVQVVIKKGSVKYRWRIRRNGECSTKGTEAAAWNMKEIWSKRTKRRHPEQDSKVQLEKSNLECLKLAIASFSVNDCINRTVFLTRVEVLKLFV